VIYRRYRQIKRRLLFEKVVEARRQKHTNCLYGVCVSCYDENGVHRTLRLCAFQCHRDVVAAKDEKKTTINDVLKDVELCVRSNECTAFINKRKNVKEAVIKEFEEELKNQDTKSKLYPELSAYEWVLDKNLYDASQSPSLFVRMIVGIINVLEKMLKGLQKNKYVT